MHLKSLYLHNFRGYREAFYTFKPGFNVICGPNAQGKTSLLEATYFMMTGRSFRGAQTSELIRHGADAFYLEARFLKLGVEHLLRATCSKAGKKFVYNSTLLPGTSSVLGLLQGVVASPDDVSLVKGPPAVRRQYLDLQIAQVDPLYVYHLNRYARALRQRNCLLRGKQVLTIESWEHEMACSASYITKQRALAASEISKVLQSIHGELAGSEETLSVLYRLPLTEGELEEHFLLLFKKCRRREIELGTTLFGPHKDELHLSIDGRDIRSYASEGQQRTSVTTLRCAEWQRICGVAEAAPLMLVDDAALGLDARRQRLFIQYLEKMPQVLLTTTDPGIAANKNVHSILLGVTPQQ